MAKLLVALQLGCRGGDPPQADGTTFSAPAISKPPFSDPPSSNSEGPSHARAGFAIRTPYYQIRVSTPQDCTPRERGAASDVRRVGVDVWLEPTGSVQVPANPYYAKLVDTEGNVYEATLGGCGAPLAPTLPKQGQPARGRIVFEIPRSAHASTFTYAPELAHAPKSELEIKLTAKAPRTP